MQTITITVEDGGRITVDVQENGQPAGEPYRCESSAECLDYVRSVMGEERGEAPQEQAAEPAEDYAAAWSEEAAKRPKNPQMLS